MPVWEGCIRLIAGEDFLLAPNPWSFDSRYFGPVLRCDVIGIAKPLWTWNPDLASAVGWRWLVAKPRKSP